MKLTDYCGRHAYGWDMSGDGVTTVTDIWLLSKAVFLAPSNLSADFLQLFPRVAEFFEMTCDTGQGLGGAVLSLFIWMIVWVVLVDSISPSK